MFLIVSPVLAMNASLNITDPMERTLNNVRSVCSYTYIGIKNLILGWTLSALKAPNKIAADDTKFFFTFFSRKIRLDVSCESTAEQWIHLKYQVLFFLKKQMKK